MLTATCLLLFGAAGCSKGPDPAAAAESAAVPQNAGSLLVKSNRAQATVEAVRAGDATATAAKGSANQPLTGLAAGNYVITAHSEGWLDLRTEATVNAGGTTEVTMNFRTGSLRLESEPSGATVKQAGNVLGKTPLTLPQLPLGEQALTLEYPAWPALTFKTTINENVESAETVRLPHGKLVVESVPAGATILIGNKPFGQTPLTWERIPPGTRKLVLQAPGFPPTEISVTVEDRGETKVSPMLGAAFPELDPDALLRAVWVPDNPDKLAPSFDSVTGMYAPQNGIVKNLHRKKLGEGWLKKNYRYSGTVKSYDRENGEIEFAEQKGDLSRYRIVAKLATLGDKDLGARLAKDATFTFYGRLTAAEEPRWPSKVITFEFLSAEPLP